MGWRVRAPVAKGAKVSNRMENQGDATPVNGMADLVALFAAGEKPPARWRIGTEHEKFVFRRTDLRSPSYEESGGIGDLLDFFTRFGWEPVVENGHVIALAGADGGISLEPAGQFELSGAPLENIHQTCAEITRHLHQCREAGAELGLGFLGMGANPVETRAALPVMPKGRYDIMLRYMPKVGHLGLDMMLRTATVQTNLDYATEADMVRKFRVSLALQPVATALFANSPFTEGRPNGFLSWRSHVWTDTDPARTGMLPFVFEDGFGYERYAEYALDMPMYFVTREGKYIDAAGLSFRDFLAGNLSVLPGERPTLGDWKDHLSTAFPEVRLKSFLEMRGADSGPQSHVCALPALWVGLLYDVTARDAAWDLVKHWTIADHAALRGAVPRLGLDAPAPDGGTIGDLAQRVLDIAESGLKSRACLDDSGNDERGFLNPLREIATSGKTLAQQHLSAFNGEWRGDIQWIYEVAGF